MKIIIAAIGKLKNGAERDLFERYQLRANRAGPALGFNSFDVIELPESRAGSANERKSNEAKALLAAIPTPVFLVALDEHGKKLNSRAFSTTLAKERDDGATAMCFAIGGADGHGQELLSKAHLKLSLGAMTWPHQLVRTLLAEQVYRSITILSGHPYHRD